MLCAWTSYTLQGEDLVQRLWTFSVRMASSYRANPPFVVTQLFSLLSGGLTDEERQGLSSAADQPSAVVQWINAEISNRVFSGGFDIPAPIAAQLWNVLGTAMVNYTNTVKYATNSVPVSFLQCLAATDVIILCMTPLAIASFVSHISTALIINFVCTFVYHSIYAADMAMQAPFGDRAKDLPLEHLHRQFVDKILTALPYDVALQVSKLYEDANRLTALNPQRKAFCALSIESTLKRSGHAAASTSPSDPSDASEDSPRLRDQTAIIDKQVVSPLRLRGLSRLHTNRSQDPRNPSHTILMMAANDRGGQGIPLGSQVMLPPQARRNY
eukprot:Protomagalhaensia_sp_Gyna_25__4749@NODE_469_length_3351_cov_22_814010_g363_i0_p2_GENE_NODE_469_length_3351_cov_22_814010_g363_i0NODE_469_length_3351_cov_22_814010_g363_i0_p2_ORF_typecomplete_len328_score34_06Bestrophin/PF01062_21/4_5e10Yip1/PF04893_17/0_076_NODE_469_length_3351_cov_22_814010_g363_i019972980